MDLVSMKNTPAEAKQEATAMPDAPEYPYGLRVSLDEGALKKLGISALPDVGAPMALYARVEVCGTSAYESTEGGKRQSMDLQITDLALEAERRRLTPEEMYPTMKK